MTQAGIQDLIRYKGQTVYDQQGEKIGKFEDIYADTQSGTPEWIGVNSGGLMGSKHVLVPLQGYSPREDGISVAYSKDRVNDAPEVKEDEIGEQREDEIYEYYGLRRAGLRQPTETFDPKKASQTQARQGDSVTRSEEQMRVGKREVEGGRARLRKWVETEPVSQDVNLRREKAYVEREPINQPVSGAQLGEQEVDVSLRREEPVVQKETVAKERVSMRKGTEETTETVQDELRKERVEMEGDIEDRGGRPR
jgi:uncharacterized protein (TIGR02271 family)